MHAVFATFIAWFNANLKGETIFNTDDATMKTRLRQYAHVRQLSADDALMLALMVSAARNEQERADLNA